MTGDFESLSLINELTDSEIDLFKSAVRILLSKTFIIRGLAKEAELYDFTIRNSAIFDAWFACMDAAIVRDESLGVVSFRGGGDTRIRLHREETCALLVARLLYEEKRAELSLAAFPVVTVLDFIEKYNTLTDDKINKTHLTDVLRRLQSHKLIGVDSWDLSDSEGMILLYPSLAMVVDRDSIDELVAQTGKGRSEETGEIEPELPKDEDGGE